MRRSPPLLLALAMTGCLAETHPEAPDATRAAADAFAADAFAADASAADADAFEPDATAVRSDAAETAFDAGSIELDCTEACARTTTDVGWARCYACQCKRAMDGWLPSAQELQCERGAPIVPYTASSTGALSPITERRSECANPSLLYGACAPGGTLGQLRHGDVSVKWICRRNNYVAPAVRDRTLISDMGAILHNERTGATCYFDDRDNVTAPLAGVPALDIIEASDAEIERWLQTFYNTDGEGCVTCHAADPFVYTPYLASAGWITGAHPLGPYTRVTVSGALVPAFRSPFRVSLGLAPAGRVGPARQTMSMPSPARLASGHDPFAERGTDFRTRALEPVGVQHLVSPEAARCTTCHRLAEGPSCSRFVRDALGLDKQPPHEATIRDAAQTHGDAWRLVSWMPSPQPFPTYEAWAADTRVAREHILDCCSEAKMGRNTFRADGSPECVWRAVP
jgi:hypothetical protein